MNVRSRAHRILKSLKSYQQIEQGEGINCLLPPLEPGDCWIGLYRNVPGSSDNAVAFSSERLYVNERGEWVSIKYSDIMDTQIYEDKSEATEVFVRTPDYNLLVPISGGDGKVREAFEVLRFLNRVREDLRGNRASLAREVH